MRFSLLPYAESYIKSQAVAPTGSDTRMRLDYTVDIEGPGGIMPGRDLAVELKGPGDIIGLEPGMIKRIEPAPGLRGFEPNYFTHVEFEDCDFPTRYSTRKSAQGYPIPWLVLIALKADEFEFMDVSRGPLRKIKVFDVQASLPHLSQSWAFSHIHAELPDTQQVGEVNEAVQAESDRSWSRLLCPRQLEGKTSYHAFLVPSFEAGRLAGIGKENAASAYDAFSWDTMQSGVEIELPYYHHYTFITDELEDVELLLRRLKGVSSDDLVGVGVETISANRPGYYDYTSQGKSFSKQSAMKLNVGPSESGSSDEPYNTDLGLAQKMVDTLNQVMDYELEDDLDGEDPLFALPPYGFLFKPENDVSIDRAEQNVWFDRLNLDLKFRHAAGVGADIVRENQEYFMYHCWSQFEDIVEANRKLSLLQASEVMAGSLTKRHFEKLPDAVSLSLSESAHQYVTVDGNTTLAMSMRQDGAPSSYFSKSARRVAAKRAVKSAQEQSVQTPMLPVKAETKLQRGLAVHQSVAAQILTQSVKAPVASEAAELETVFANPELATAQAPKAFVVNMRTPAVADHTEKLSTFYQNLPRAKAVMTIAGLTEDEALGAVKPILRSPVLNGPTSIFLEAMGADNMVAGSDEIPQNSIAVFVENRKFIEAFLVGMNHEMSHELRWRGFPTDMRGTVFRAFWNKGLNSELDANEHDDILPIHEWTGELGQNGPDNSGQNSESLIILMKGDIVRKLRNPIVSLRLGANDIAPAFMGKIGLDTAFYGFSETVADVTAQAQSGTASLVIMEPKGALRFGLDIGTAKIRQDRRNDENMAYAFPMLHQSAKALRPSLRMSGNSASLSSSAGNTTPDFNSWADLSWSQITIHASGYINFAENISAPSGAPNLWSTNKTSASIAQACFQQPVAGILPLARVL